ncbi:hypothetical protein ACHQM5_003263 [Ranunculus cassubicifolius]
MELSEVVEFARNFAVMVRAQGPDPKGLKMQKHAFHHYNSGQTTISASGMLLPDSCTGSLTGSGLKDAHGMPTLVVTVASIVEPFLLPQHRESITQGSSELIPGAQIDVMIERKLMQGNNLNHASEGTRQWTPSKLLALVDVPASSFALQSLLEASGVSPEHGSWEVGWSLALLNNSPQSLIDGPGRQVGHDGRSQNHSQSIQSVSRKSGAIAMSTIKIAFLGVPSVISEGLPDINISSSSKRGDILLAMGSPFGVLSPAHFFNSISVGTISNFCPSTSHSSSLLMADIRCLPGMEGAPVFNDHARLIGIMSRPLRQSVGGAEIQLVIPWEAITLAQSNFVDSKRNVSAVEKTMASVALVTVDEGTWASGVVLNDSGLILTNAHLLEPWRFDKGNLPPATYSSLSSGFRRIRVRLDHVNPRIWCDARVVYISKGPLDIALLQLENVPENLSPIIPDFTCPSPGSKAYVIGHGLFGPRTDLSSSVSSGVVARVVKAQMHLHPIEPGVQSPEEITTKCLPAMLETTASVHAGGSGGAVVNSDGHLIGLVTSNARHGGGIVIPQLNFSIPCATMELIFKFSKDATDVAILQDLDKPNDHLSSVWALMPPLSPKQVPAFLHQPPDSLPEKNPTEKKGSRFAKFIAERNGEVFLGPNNRVKVGKASNQVFSSKL